MIFSDRCYHYVELLHNVQRIPFHIASRIKLDSYECLGRRMYVFHLRIAARVRVRELRGQKTTSTQRGVPTRGEPGNTGELTRVTLI